MSFPNYGIYLMENMFFVGPGLEKSEIAKEYRNQILDFKLRLQVKAGFTGCAQVYENCHFI